MVGTKRRDMGLGGFPDVTLAGAREAARVARDKIKQGIDPVEDAKASASAFAAAQASALTFTKPRAKYIAANEAGWKNAKHAAQWTSTLETYAYPTIGKIQVSAIETQHIVGILEPIWTTKTETASRLRGRIEAVLDWAKVRGYRKGDNPARWKGHLDHILPARAKVQKVKHHTALDYREVGAFMASLKGLDGMGARALEFAILTAARSGEVRGATWAEIDERASVVDNSGRTHESRKRTSRSVDRPGAGIAAQAPKNRRYRPHLPEREKRRPIRHDTNGCAAPHGRFQ